METQRGANHVTPGENNAFDHLRPLETILPLLRQMTSVSLPFDDVAEQAIICLDKIGNTRRARYAVETPVEDGYAELPANCDQVDAVLVSASYSTISTGLSQIHGVVHQADTSFLQAPVGSFTGPVAVAPDQISGLRHYRFGDTTAIDLRQYGSRYVDYTFRDGGLYVGRQASASELVRQAARMGCEVGEIEADGPQLLRVFYRGIVADERGYPLITPQEALACAYFILMVETQKKFFQKEATGDQVQLAKQISGQHIAQARVAGLASSNGLDKLLDEGKRHHRHFVNDDLYVK